MIVSWFQRPAIVAVVNHLAGHATIDADVLAGNESGLRRIQNTSNETRRESTSRIATIRFLRSLIILNFFRLLLKISCIPLPPFC